MTNSSEDGVAHCKSRISSRINSRAVAFVPVRFTIQESSIMLFNFSPGVSIIVDDSSQLLRARVLLTKKRKKKVPFLEPSLNR